MDCVDCKLAGTKRCEFKMGGNFRIEGCSYGEQKYDDITDRDCAYLTGISMLEERVRRKLMTRRRLHKKTTAQDCIGVLDEAIDEARLFLTEASNFNGRRYPVSPKQVRRTR